MMENKVKSVFSGDLWTFAPLRTLNSFYTDVLKS